MEEQQAATQKGLYRPRQEAEVPPRPTVPFSAQELLSVTAIDTQRPAAVLTPSGINSMALLLPPEVEVLKEDDGQV